MAHDEEIQWQPITALPMIGDMVRGTLVDTEQQYQTLKEGETKPHVLDDATVDRVIEVYQEQTEFVGIYEEQLLRWKQLQLTAPQCQDIDQLTGEVNRLGKVTAEILALAAKLREGTINRIMEKDDAELALEILTGKRKL